MPAAKQQPSLSNRFIFPFFLQAQLSLLQKANVGGNTSAWSNHDQRHRQVTRWVEVLVGPRKYLDLESY